MSTLPPHVKLLLESLPLPRPTTVVDVGANPINETPYKALLQGGGCLVVGFEPQADAYEELQRSKGPNESYYPYAVGDGGTHRLHVYRSSGFTSFFLPHLPATKVFGRGRWSRIMQSVDLPTVALDDLPDLAPFDMLKIDIQGGETLVLENARRVLSEAVAVVVELRYLRLYEDEPMVGGVDQCLRDQGFMLHKFLSNKSRPLPNSQSFRLSRRRTADQLIDGDGVYLRHVGILDSYGDGQLMHLAVLAAGVFLSHSVALHALDELVRRGLIPDTVPASYVDALPREFRA
jgi:FkbM family methyltransferase